MAAAACSLSPHCGGESEIEGLGERKPPKLQISQVRGSVEEAQHAPQYPTASRFSSSVKNPAAPTLAQSASRSQKAPPPYRDPAPAAASPVNSPRNTESDAPSASPAAARSGDRRRGWLPGNWHSVVAGNAEQHRRHTEGECYVAGSPILRLDEIHVLGRQPHRFPVEPAFEQQGPPARMGPE